MIQRRVGARASHSRQLWWLVGGCFSDLSCCRWTVVTFILAWRKWCGKICMCRAKKWTKAETARALQRVPCRRQGRKDQKATKLRYAEDEQT
uniref:Uncharacterized protein n=1 Tax=Aegilops tauschii subsp. strangulata TaxID=200361 RepID=A0A452XXT8_AEGTS